MEARRRHCNCINRCVNYTRVLCFKLILCINLEQLKLAWKHSEPIFKATIHIDHTHKHYGLKVILTQIIANLAHLSRETQDLVSLSFVLEYFKIHL